jgi:hypothetical protein
MKPRGVSAIALGAGGACLVGAVLLGGAAGQSRDATRSPVYGVALPPGYRDWTLISVAQENGHNDDIRAILGNDIAVKAFRQGRRPFPDGTIIVRLA